MAYDPISPTLAALEPVKALPGYGEAANVLYKVIQQTRIWAWQFFDLYFAEGYDTLQPYAFEGGTRPVAVIRGTNLVDASEREIKQASVQGIDILAGSLTDPNFADGAITNDKIAAFTSSEHVKDATIGDTKLAPLQFDLQSGDQVSAVKLASRAVTQDKIASDPFGVNCGIATLGLQAHAVDGRKLPSGEVTQWLVGGQTVTQGSPPVVRTKCLAPVTLKAPFTIDTEGKVTMERITTAMGFVFGFKGVTDTVLPAGKTQIADGLVGNWLHYPFDDQKLVTGAGTVQNPNEAYVFAAPSATGVEFLKPGGYLVFLRTCGYRTDGFRTSIDARLDGAQPNRVRTFYSNCGYTVNDAGSSDYFATTPNSFFASLQVSNILGYQSVANPKLEVYVHVETSPGSTASLGRTYAGDRSAVDDNQPIFGLFLLLLKIY